MQRAYLAAMPQLRLLTARSCRTARPCSPPATSTCCPAGACGAGWLQEFEAISAPDFDRRGAVTNEYIRAFKELWTSDEPTFDGRVLQLLQPPL